MMNKNLRSGLQFDNGQNRLHQGYLHGRSLSWPHQHPSQANQEHP